MSAARWRAFDSGDDGGDLDKGPGANMGDMGERSSAKYPLSGVRRSAPPSPSSSASTTIDGSDPPEDGDSIVSDFRNVLRLIGDGFVRLDMLGSEGGGMRWL